MANSLEANINRLLPVFKINPDQWFDQDQLAKWIGRSSLSAQQRTVLWHMIAVGMIEGKAAPGYKGKGRKYLYRLISMYENSSFHIPNAI